MRAAYAKTERILKEHYDKLELVAETLIEKEKLTGEEFLSLMNEGKLPEKEEPEIKNVDETVTETVGFEEAETVTEEAETVTEAEEITEAPQEEE